jgi:hypothetical protein
MNCFVRQNTPTSTEGTRLNKKCYTRSEVFRKGNINIVVLWVITPRTLAGTTNISDKDTASIFQVKLKMKAVYSSEILVTTY